MEIYANGWQRDSGRNWIGNVDLVQVGVGLDKKKAATWNEPAMMKIHIKGSGNAIGIEFKNELKLTGSYRVRANINYDEIICLFKAAFGSELNMNIFKTCGFTIGSDLQKQTISGLRIGDLTLNELANLVGPPPAGGQQG